MSLVLPKESDAEFENPPADTHVGTCYRVIDLGTQQVTWEGKTKKQHKVLLSWELSNAAMEDGRPFTVHKKYTLSSYETSNFRKDLEAWRGAPFTEEDLGRFDLVNLIGKACLLQIIHAQKNGKTYANIAAIMKLPKGTETPALTNPTVYLSLNSLDQTVYEGLSDSLKETIRKSPEYHEALRHTGEVANIVAGNAVAAGAQSPDGETPAF